MSQIEKYDDKRFTVCAVNDFMKRLEKEMPVFTDVADVEQKVLDQLTKLHFTQKPDGPRYRCWASSKYLNIGCTEKGCQYRYWFRFETDSNAKLVRIKFDRVIKRLHNYPLH